MSPKIELDETYDRWLYDNNFEWWMMIGALNSAREITTIERDALIPIDGKIIFNIDTKEWEYWSRTSNKWFLMKGESKDGINTQEELKEIGVFTNEGLEILP